MSKNDAVWVEVEVEIAPDQRTLDVYKVPTVVLNYVPNSKDKLQTIMQDRLLPTQPSCVPTSNTTGLFKIIFLNSQAKQSQTFACY